MNPLPIQSTFYISFPNFKTHLHIETDQLGFLGVLLYILSSVDSIQRHFSASWEVR